MDKNWLKILLAGGFEVGWVIGLKHANSFGSWALTLVAIFFSFYLLISASEELPVGTAYAVFVGIGTTGTVLLESFLFEHSLSVIKIGLILLLLAGVIGLKVVTPTIREQKEVEN